MWLTTRKLGVYCTTANELTSEENGALREVCVDVSQSESAALDRRETKKVLPLWLTGGL